MAYETPLTIFDVVQDISANKYILPSIQREFTWTYSQIEQLFDSLMQEYPIGTFLFWELPQSKYTDYEFYKFLQDYHERNARHNPKINLNGSDQVMAVLDGQQRLTSIFIGLKGTYAYKIPRLRWNNDNAFPKRKLYLNIVGQAQDGNNKYDFRFLTDEEIKSAEGKSDYCWFEIGQILNMPDLSAVTKYVNRKVYKNDLYSEGQDDFAMDCMAQLYKVIHTQPIISYYKVKSEELDKVLNIFIRVNSGGTPLSYSDLLLSIAAAQWETLDAREEITEFVDELNSIGRGFNVNKDFMLKASLVLSDFRNIAFKVDNFNKTNMLQIEKNWPTIKASVYAAYSLVSSFGFTRDSLKSNNALIPIAYYLKMLGVPANFDTATVYAQNRKIIKKWLIMSLIKRTFSGQPDNVLRPLRELISENGQKDFPLDAIIERLRGTSKSIIFTKDDIDMLLEHRYGEADTLTALMLLYPQLDFNNKFHIDHMYPKSKFTKKILRSKGVGPDLIGEYMDQVNSIANLQLLAAIPNIEKQDTDFDVWFEATHPTDSEKIEYRTVNYLPSMEYSYANFLTFISERQKLMRNRFEELLL